MINKSTKRCFNTKISNIKYLSNDVMEVTFKIEDGIMDFTPGQFILIKVSESQKILRAYSVLKYNLETNEISVCIKRVESGVATKIIFDTFKVGLEVEITGAIGHELIVNKEHKNLLLVATDMGIAPMLCILEDLTKSDYNGKISFMYGTRTRNELFYLEKILNIVATNSNVEFMPVLSDEYDENTFKGSVTQAIEDIYINDKYIYMCGSKQIANSFKEILTEKGFNLSKFYSESV